MSKGAKIAIIVTVVVLGLFGSCVGGVMWWWSENGEEFLSAARTGMADGARWGETATDQNHCIDEGVERSAGCGQMAISCGTQAQLFTQGCLYTAPKVEGICDGVPGPTDIMDSVSWTTENCKDRGQTLNNFCGNIFGSLQAYCDNPDAEIDFEQLASQPAQ